jgi:hypothetical protein
LLSFVIYLLLISLIISITNYAYLLLLLLSGRQSGSAGPAARTSGCQLSFLAKYLGGTVHPDLPHGPCGLNSTIFSTIETILLYTYICSCIYGTVETILLL